MVEKGGRLRCLAQVEEGVVENERVLPDVRKAYHLLRMRICSYHHYLLAGRHRMSEDIIIWYEM